MVKGFHVNKGFASALVLSLLLAACGGGGGGGDGESPSAQTPTAPATPTTPTTPTDPSPPGVAELVSFEPTYSTLAALVASDPAANANVNFNATSAPVVIGRLEFSSPSAGHLRLYNEGTRYAINLNGSSVDALGASGSITLPASFRYVAVTGVSAGQIVTANYTYTLPDNCSNCVNAALALVDSNGKILASKVIATSSPQEENISATAETTGKVYLVFSRNGDTNNGSSTGGVRIWSIRTASATAPTPPTDPVTSSLVFHANFLTLGNSGLEENKEATLAAADDMPTAVNARGYTAQLIGKLKINTTQGLPNDGSDNSWSKGVLQTGNDTGSIGKAIVQNVSCPFKLTVNHASSSTDAARKLVITFNGSEVYNQGSGATSTGLAAVIDSATASSPCTTGTTTIEAYGFNGTKGAGVRIYDLKIEQ